MRGFQHHICTEPTMLFCRSIMWTVQPPMGSSLPRRCTCPTSQEPVAHRSTAPTVPLTRTGNASPATAAPGAWACRLTSPSGLAQQGGQRVIRMAAPGAWACDLTSRAGFITRAGIA